jgi:hypothetical protein
MDRILNMSLLPLTALSKLTADRSPRSARRGPLAAGLS